MKNNKKTTYVLLAAVALVWGLIFYRIFDGLSSDDTMTIPVHQTSLLPITTDKSLSFELLANYRDPFLGKAYSIDKKSNPPKPRAKKKKVEKLVKSKDLRIDFLGLISNPSLKKKVGIIRYNNKEQMVEEGQELLNITIIKFTKDSVLVKHSEGKQWFR